MKTILAIFLFTLSLCAVAHGRTLTVEDQLLRWDDGSYAVIKERNSPENALIESEINFERAIDGLDQAYSMGLNTIYVVGFSGDDMDVHPFLDRNNPSLGFDEDKLNIWRQYLGYWTSLSRDNMIHFCITEYETHYSLDDSTHRAMIDKFLEYFGDLPVIWDREEVYRDGDWLRYWYCYLAERMDQWNTNGVIAIHNQPGQEPWQELSRDCLDLVSYQGTLEDADWRMAGAFNDGFAVYASEIMPYWVGIEAGNVGQTLDWYDSFAEGSSGAGFYLGLNDQTRFLDLEPWRENFEALQVTDISQLRNTQLWWNYQNATPFLKATDVSNSPMTLLSPGDAYGSLETRTLITPLSEGIWRITAELDVQDGLSHRLRVFIPGSPWETTMRERANGGGDLSAYYYSDGFSPFKIAIDMNSVGGPTGTIVLKQIHAEKMSLN